MLHTTLQIIMDMCHVIWNILYICYKYVNILILIQCKQNIERNKWNITYELVPWIVTQQLDYKKHGAKSTGWCLFTLTAQFWLLIKIVLARNSDLQKLNAHSLWKLFGHSLVSQLGKCQHWQKPLIICPKPSNMVRRLHLWGKLHRDEVCESMVLACLKEETCWIWIWHLWPTSPWSLDLQLHKLCGSVTEPSLPTLVRFFILFLRELCQFAFSYYN